MSKSDKQGQIEKNSTDTNDSGGTSGSAGTAPIPKATKRKKGSKRSLKAKAAKRGRKIRPFPASTFEDALELAETIQKFASGQDKVRKLTVFDKLGRSPDGGPSRQLITNSSRYGLTKGGYQAEFLELTPDGKLATAEDVALAKKLESRFKLAIRNVEPFNHLYEKYKGTKMPSKEFLADDLRQVELPEEFVAECIDTFILNVKFLGLLKTAAGSERLISLDHAMEELGSTRAPQSQPSGDTPTPPASETAQQIRGEDFDKIYFYVTPIGVADSDQRQHSDFFMEQFVIPAVKEVGLNVVRADQIGKPGMIGKQILEYILKARLVIADLSFQNPNVYYELCLRHATRLPTVQIIRSSDKIPFDIQQYRTIQIDTGNPYTFALRVQTHQAEIANQVRRALDDADMADNPISLYYPSLRLDWDKG